MKLAAGWLALAPVAFDYTDGAAGAAAFLVALAGRAGDLYTRAGTAAEPATAAE